VNLILKRALRANLNRDHLVVGYITPKVAYHRTEVSFSHNTGCGKLTSFFEYEMPYEKGSYTGCGKLTSFYEYEMPYEKGS
jgi:hypothetical protein